MKTKICGMTSPPYEGGDGRGGWNSLKSVQPPPIPLLRKEGGLNQSGVTFIELLVVLSILVILSALALPVAKFSVRRHKEIELHQNLRMIRNAIDAYHEAAVPSTPGVTPKIQVKFGTDGWPPTLEALVEGEPIIGDATGKKIRFLRRIPLDPITNTYEWGLRASQDEPDSKNWGGENVWDVYCKSEAMSLDGVTKYSEW
jgi:general secretion pathway protein G